MLNFRNITTKRFFQASQILQIYRILQEALNNIIKHAEATQVVVQVFGHEREVNITVEDDGKGFEKQENHSRLRVESDENKSRKSKCPT